MRTPSNGAGDRASVSSAGTEWGSSSIDADFAQELIQRVSLIGLSLAAVANSSEGATNGVGEVLLELDRIIVDIRHAVFTGVRPAEGLSGDGTVRTISPE